MQGPASRSAQPPRVAALAPQLLRSAPTTTPPAVQQLPARSRACGSSSPTPPAAATTPPPAPRPRPCRTPSSPTTSRCSTPPAPVARSACSGSSTRRAKTTSSCRWGSASSGAVYTNKSKATLNDTVPIAKLIEESEAIVVPKGSPYDDPRQARRRPGRPTRARCRVGGAPTPGGPDHLTPMLLAKAVGVDPEGRQLRRRTTAVASCSTGSSARRSPSRATGIGEVAEQAKSGDVKILAVTSAEPVEGVDAPTLKSPASTWCSPTGAASSARPGFGREDQQYVDRLTKMHGTAAVEEDPGRPGLDRRLPDRRRVQPFLTAENDRVAGILKELGLASMSPRTQDRADQVVRCEEAAPSSGWPSCSAPSACWAIVDALLRPGTPLARGPVRPKTVPIAVGVLLVVAGRCSRSTSSAAAAARPRAARTSTSRTRQRLADDRPAGRRVRRQRAADRPGSAGRSPARSCSSGRPTRWAAGTTSATRSSPSSCRSAPGTCSSSAWASSCPSGC